MHVFHHVYLSEGASSKSSHYFEIGDGFLVGCERRDLSGVGLGQITGFGVLGGECEELFDFCDSLIFNLIWVNSKSTEA